MKALAVLALLLCVAAAATGDVSEGDPDWLIAVATIGVLSIIAMGVVAYKLRERKAAAAPAPVAVVQPVAKAAMTMPPPPPAASRQPAEMDYDVLKSVRELQHQGYKDNEIEKNLIEMGFSESKALDVMDLARGVDTVEGKGKAKTVLLALAGGFVALLILMALYAVLFA